LLIKQKMRLGIAVTEKTNESASNGWAYNNTIRTHIVLKSIKKYNHSKNNIPNGIILIKKLQVPYK
jgi:hypothetical protein